MLKMVDSKSLCMLNSGRVGGISGVFGGQKNVNLEETGMKKVLAMVLVGGLLLISASAFASNMESLDYEEYYSRFIEALDLLNIEKTDYYNFPLSEDGSMVGFITVLQIMLLITTIEDYIR